MAFSKTIYLVLGLILLVRTGLFLLNTNQTISITEGSVTLTGLVETSPKVTGKSQSFSFQNYFIVTRPFPVVEYGDRITVTGVSDTKAKILFPQVKIIEKAKGNFVLQVVFKFKKYLINNFQTMLPEPQAGLMAGILLGEKSALEPKLKEDLRNAGLTHVVAASGTNLTFLSTIIMGLAILLAGRRWGSLIAIPVIWLYAVMAGFEAAVIRAGIMVSFTYLAGFFGRETGKWRGLVLACYLMILYDPAIITNLGFQLSVAAMSGIIAVGSKGILWETSAAQIATLPIIITVFGRYSLLSLVANILTLWTIPWIMSFGLIAGLLGSTPLAGAAIIPAQILLTWFVTIVTFFGSQNLMVLEAKGIDPTTTIGIYFLLISVYLYIKNYDQKRA